MPFPTSTYGYAMARGEAGMLADMDSGTYVRTWNNGEAVDLPAGIAVKKGATDDAVLLPAALGDANTGILGVVVRVADVDTSWVQGSTPPVPPNLYKAGAPMNVLLRGTILVIAEEAVAKGDIAFVRYASGSGGTQKGAFRKSADTTTAGQCSGARFMTTTTTTNQIAELMFDSVRAGTA